tara:strand:- start:48038 stop:48208 length:171 start_codon:yes stop_codon:yes gene_type:complete
MGLLLGEKLWVELPSRSGKPRATNNDLDAKNLYTHSVCKPHLRYFSPTRVEPAKAN